MKKLTMPAVGIAVLFFLLPLAPGSLLAQPVSSATLRGSNPVQQSQQCDYFLHLPNNNLPNNKVTLMPSPSPSDPGYGTKPEQLLNKMSYIEASDALQINNVQVSTGVSITQNKWIVCPFSLQGPSLPLPYQMIATPSEKITQSGKPFPKGNYPTAHWPYGPYRIYHIHYSIAPKDLKFYSQKYTVSGTTSSMSNDYHQMGPEDIPYRPYRYYMLFGIGYFEFTTVLSDNNGAIVNSTDATVLIRVAPDKAKRMLQSGVGLDQTIAVPASGTFRLRAVVTDPASKRGSKSELTLDAANPTPVETPPVRPNPTSK